MLASYVPCGPGDRVVNMNWKHIWITEYRYANKIIGGQNVLVHKGQIKNKKIKTLPFIQLATLMKVRLLKYITYDNWCSSQKIKTHGAIQNLTSLVFLIITLMSIVQYQTSIPH